MTHKAFTLAVPSRHCKAQRTTVRVKARPVVIASAFRRAAIFGRPRKFTAFTLAEVLITLAIIGIVAALTIPSVITNTQQAEFKTGLKKAISVLNSAITMNIALENESPYDNQDLFRYLQRHMSVLESTTMLRLRFVNNVGNGELNSYANAAFYTTDGMRFEFNRNTNSVLKPTYETGTPLCEGSTVFEPYLNSNGEMTGGSNYCGGCGSLGLNNNPDGTTKPPCHIIVDVNGDRKPNPANVNCSQPVGETYPECSRNNFYKLADPDGKKFTDIFPIMITDKEAVPYGAAAQRAMYGGK